MPTLTRDNAKQRCLTCLFKLGPVGGGNSNAKRNELVNSLEAEDEEDLRDFKDICINIATNSELQHLLQKYIAKKLSDCNDELPQNLCLVCYNKLQSFEKFRKRAQDCYEKLQKVLMTGDGVAKVEIEFGEENTSNEPADEVDVELEGVCRIEDDIYSVLMKNTLMETESVLLDNNGVAPLSSVEMQVPDPFDTSLPAKELHKNDPDDFWWQKQTTNNDTENDDDSSCAAGNFDMNITAGEDGDDDDEYTDGDDIGVCTRSRRSSSIKSSRKIDAQCMSNKKKRRRTKKEMVEYRQQVAKVCETDPIDDLQDSKLKRRNKGTKNNFKCIQCNHCFAHKITLDAHIRKIHEGSKRPYQCDRCDKAYTFIGGLYTHIKEIHEAEVRSYACDYTGCDRVYTSFIAMQKHKRLKHTDALQQKKYVCEQCGATFNQSGNLKYHRRTKHPTAAEQAEKEREKERYSCDICQKQFHSRYTLKYHTLQLHTDDMKFECKVCGRRMAKKFMLVQHMHVHSTEKMPCEHCGKQFIRKFELEAHIRAVHMKLKPFECQYCSECFASRKTLRHHEYIHTGEKPYVCDICGRAYRQQTCLKNHRKAHDKIAQETVPIANINRTLNTLLTPANATMTEATLAPPAEHVTHT